MTRTSTERFGIFLLLALVMAATRLHHFSVIPDASWGVFFLAGFWLRGSARWAFALLIAEAVLIDFFVITGQGIDFWTHYCVSPAYWSMPAYFGALWFGGSWAASWMSNLGDWYLPFLGTTALYVGIGAALHVAITLYSRRPGQRAKCARAY